MTDQNDIRAALARLTDAVNAHDSDAPVVTRLRALAEGASTKMAGLQTGSQDLLQAIGAATEAVAAIDADHPDANATALDALQALGGFDSSGGARRRTFGWLPDRNDPRDQLYSAPLSALKALPPSIDMRAQMPPVYDQGRLGSCTGNAIAACVQFARAKANEDPDFVPSRLFIYYNEREIEGTVPLDAGAQIRDGLKSVGQIGVCSEADWPYDSAEADEYTHLFPAGARAAARPDATCYGTALQYLAISYWSMVPSLSQLKACLSEGFPFVFGFYVYDSFYDASGRPKARIERPNPTDEYLGGHAVVAVGYDDDRQAFIIRNSWGPDTQEAGYFQMSYAYVTDQSLSRDFWTIRAIKS